MYRSSSRYLILQHHPPLFIDPSSNIQGPPSSLPLASPHQAAIWGVSKLQETSQIIASYLATSQADAASHWSGVGCMRFHRIAHPFLPSSYDTNKRLAKCTLVCQIVLWRYGVGQPNVVSVFSFRFPFVSKLGGIGHATSTQRGCEHSHCEIRLTFRAMDLLIHSRFCLSPIPSNWRSGS